MADQIWIIVLAPIVAAVIGGGIGAIVTYRVQQRKWLTFLIERSEDITRGLRQHHRSIRFKIDDKEVLNLNRSAVTVRNTGNVSISDIAFDIMLSGIHPLFSTDVEAEDLSVRSAVKVTEKYGSGEVDPMFVVEVPYINPGESFSVRLLFDRELAECEIYCRMEGVRVQIRRFSSEQEMIELASESLTNPVGFFISLVAKQLARIMGVKPRRR